MNRAFYFVGGVVALIFVFFVQSVGVARQPGARVSSQPVAPNPAAAPDATSAAIDALAAWPAAAGR